MLRRSFAKLNLLFALILWLAAVQTLAQTPTPFSINTSPLAPTTFAVNDYVGVLDQDTKQKLEKRLIDFRKTSNPKVELAVAIIKTTGDREIADYALAIYRGWGIGTKEADNPGALLLIAVDDHKYFTEVGRDLEDELPDGLVGSLQRQYLVPALKQGDYNKAVTDTIDAYIRTIQAKQAGEGAPTPEATNQPGKKSSGGICGIVICLIVIFVILMIIFGRRNPPGGGGNDRWRGGGFGGGTSSALPWIIGSAIASSIGSGSSSSSDWGGSSGGGGGDSWGGFGGGGDAGGGGAGGSW